MTKKPANGGERWTPAQKQQLRQLAVKNTPTGLIAYKLGRSESAIYSQAAKQDTSLKPTNQSPYNRRKK